MKKNLTRKIESLLEIPPEVHSDVTKLTIVGFKELTLENYKNIVEYEDYFVKINTHVGLLNINGFNLKLEKMTNDHIRITGTIESIDMEENR